MIETRGPSSVGFDGIDEKILFELILSDESAHRMKQLPVPLRIVVLFLQVQVQEYWYEY